MLSNKSNQEIITRQVKNYGDAAIINGFMTTEWWRELLQSGKGMALLLFVQYYLRFLIWLFANSIGVVFRYRHGSKTMGTISTFYTVVLLILFNSAGIWFIFKPIILFVIPVYYLTLSWDELYCTMMVEVHSYGLMAFTVLYVMLAVASLIRIYSGKGNTDPEKRGESRLVLLLAGQSYQVGGNTVQSFVEPIITAIAGVLFWLLNDPVFSAFLWIAAASMFAQEAMDWSWQQKNRKPLLKDT